MRLGLAIVLALAVLPTSAMAGDTVIERLQGVDPAVIAAFTKDEMTRTLQVREHFAGWTVAKIGDYAKKRKLDEKKTLDAVYMVQLVAVKAISTTHAWLLVEDCKVGGLNNLMSGNATEILKCLTEANGRRNALKALPDEAAVLAWIAEAKVAGTATAQVAWNNTVAIDQAYKPDMKTVKAFKKAKLLTNVEVFDKMSLIAEREKFAKANKLDLEALNRMEGMADLLRLKDINVRFAHLLYKAGFNGLGSLMSAQIDDLEAKLKAANDADKVVPVADIPSKESLQGWIVAAKPYASH